MRACACTRRTPQALVAVLDGHPAVRALYYPGLASHPGHALAARQQHGFGAMLSVRTGRRRGRGARLRRRPAVLHPGRIAGRRGKPGRASGDDDPRGDERRKRAPRPESPMACCACRWASSTPTTWWPTSGPRCNARRTWPAVPARSRCERTGGAVARLRPARTGGPARHRDRGQCGVGAAARMGRHPAGRTPVAGACGELAVCGQQPQRHSRRYRRTVVAQRATRQFAGCRRRCRVRRRRGYPHRDRRHRFRGGRRAPRAVAGQWHPRGHRLQARAGRVARALAGDPVRTRPRRHRIRRQRHGRRRPAAAAQPARTAGRGRPHPCGRRGAVRVAGLAVQPLRRLAPVLRFRARRARSRLHRTGSARRPVRRGRAPQVADPGARRRPFARCRRGAGRFAAGAARAGRARPGESMARPAVAGRATARTSRDGVQERRDIALHRPPAGRAGWPRSGWRPCLPIIRWSVVPAPTTGSRSGRTVTANARW